MGRGGGRVGGGGVGLGEVCTVGPPGSLTIRDPVGNTVMLME